MKFLVLLFFSIPLLAADLKLTGLKPLRNRTGNAFGYLSSELKNETTGKTIKYEAQLGDCPTCVRGVAIRGVFGVRFEGKDLNSLTVGAKATPRVFDPKDCMKMQSKPLKNGRFQCRLVHKEQTYSLSVTVK